MVLAPEDEGQLSAILVRVAQYNSHRNQMSAPTQLSVRPIGSGHRCSVV